MKVIEDKFSCSSLYAFKSPDVNKEIETPNGRTISDLGSNQRYIQDLLG